MTKYHKVAIFYIKKFSAVSIWVLTRIDIKFLLLFFFAISAFHLSTFYFKFPTIRTTSIIFSLPTSNSTRFIFIVCQKILFHFFLLYSYFSHPECIISANKKSLPFHAHLLLIMLITTACEKSIQFVMQIWFFFLPISNISISWYHSGVNILFRLKLKRSSSCLCYSSALYHIKP